MRVLLVVFALAGICRAADEDPLENVIRDYLTPERFDDTWGYDRFGIWRETFFEFKFGYWFPKFRLPIHIGNLQILDLTSALNIQDQEASPVGRVTIGYADFELVIDWSDLRWFGTAEVDAGFEIGGIDFEINEQIRTDVSFESWRVIPGWRVLRTKHASVWLLTVIGLQHFKADFTGSRSQLARVNEWLPIVLLGVSASGGLGPFVYEFEFLWIGIDLGDFGGQILDVQGSVGYAIREWVAIQAGYRYRDTEGFYSVLHVESRSAGFFFTLRLRF